MHTIVLPADELNEFDLPRVCIVTGQTEGVEFKPVKFAWYPRWVAALVIVNVLIAAIVASILTQRVKGSLPFTEEAFKSWRTGRILFALSFVATIALFIAGAVTLDKSGALGGVLMVLAVAAPIAAYILFARKKGPTVHRIKDGSITLKFPSQEAVLRFQEHLNAGLKQPSTQDPAQLRSA